MRRAMFLFPVLFVFLLAVPVSAEITFGPGAEDVLYSGDGVAPLDTLFGSSLAISPGEILREFALVHMESGGRLYLQCRELPESLSGLRLSICGDGPIFEGTLGAASWIYLGNFPAGTREQLTFTLTVPKDLSRQGQLDWQDLRWQLLMELPQTPATGDHFHALAAITVAVLSAAGLWVAVKHREAFQ